MEVRTIAKRWGSSIGIVLPKRIVDLRRIKENDEIVIEIKSQPVMGNMFGRFLRKSGRSGQELKDEARKGW